MHTEKDTQKSFNSADNYTELVFNGPIQFTNDLYKIHRINHSKEEKNERKGDISMTLSYLIVLGCKRADKTNAMM